MLLAKKHDSLYKVFIKTLGFLFVLIILGLLLDSKYFIPHFPQGQILANFLVLIFFGLIYLKSSKKVKEFFIYAILIAIAGECFFSLLLKMYTYRLHNVPLYVFFGHALLYVSVLYFCKAAAVKVYQQKLEVVFTLIIISYAFLFLIFKNDYFGFILTVITLLILLKKPKERLFYLTMYLCVAYLEIIGTWYKCWYWPGYMLNLKIDFLQSANPPSGISFFYFGLDLGSLFLYKLRHKIAWKRMKKLRKIRSLN